MPQVTLFRALLHETIEGVSTLKSHFLSTGIFFVWTMNKFASTIGCAEM